MKKPLRVVLAGAAAVAVLLAASVVAQQAPPKLEVRRVEVVTPLEGLDPVLLLQGREAQGREELAVSRGIFRYLFANPETKAEFEKNPKRYEIQMGGLCARMGGATRGNPDLYVVYEGRIYVFGTEECHSRFRAHPGSYLEQAPPPLPQTPDAGKKADVLLAKAVAAAGGARAIDALRDYAATGFQKLTTPQGERESPVSWFSVLPDRARLERQFGQIRVATVVTPQDAFFLTGNAQRRILHELTPAQQAYHRKDVSRTPIEILRARKHSGFRAAALGPGRAGETLTELVGIALGDLRATLGIDPATGRVLSLAFLDRGPDGEVGEVILTFSDFRAVQGLELPFAVLATFDGKPFPLRSYTFTTIAVNSGLDLRLFSRPEPDEE